MWFDPDTEDSAGFADPCGLGIALLAFAFIAGLIALGMWIYPLPLIPS